jgi:hypothetical protein
MEKGSRLAIKKLKLVEKGGKKFYVATLLENVFNSQKPTFKGMETTSIKTYITDTSMELEEANFSLDKSKNKYSFENISNPKTSIIRLIDFKVEIHSIWNYGKQKVDEMGKPIYEPVLYITKLQADHGYKTDNAKMKELQKKVDKLTEKLAEEKESSRTNTKYLKDKIRRLEKKCDEQYELIREARQSGIIDEKRVHKKTTLKDFGEITFEDM